MRCVQDLYMGNYRILMKEIKDLNREIFHVYELKDLILLNVNSS